jgi:alginate O-acetyltransferase complex protein AlgI
MSLSPWWAGFLEHSHHGSLLLFTQGSFVVLFALFFNLYLFLRGRPFARTLYVTAFSLFFYYYNSGDFVALLLFTAVWDHGLGLAIHRTKSKPLRRAWLTLSVASNIGLLSYFKYSGLFLRTWAGWHGQDPSAADLLVPVGLSFFTFQSLSYTIDIYRRKLAPAPSVLDFLFFVSFFPHLIAGPIVRAADFLPQVRKKVRLSLAEMDEAFLLIASGLLKKVIIADTLALRLVDPVFSDPARHTGPECLLGLLGYSAQIYGDFSGYTDLALGLALLMGFRLCVNFDQPYRASSLTEFWQRWHISLSKWLRDYLYIPLGGNRHGKLRTYLNLMISMLLGGLWHGASWRYMAWGGLHGVGLGLERALGVDPARARPSWRKALGVIVTFTAVTIGWSLFRSDSVAHAALILRLSLSKSPWSLWADVLQAQALSVGLIVAGLSMHFLPLSGLAALQDNLGRWPWPFKAVALAAVFLLVWQFQGAGAQPFIYFQF